VEYLLIIGFFLLLGNGVVVLLLLRNSVRVMRKLRNIEVEVKRLPSFVWATSTVHSTVSSKFPLPNWNVWSIPPDFVVYSLAKILAERPQKIVEFGSGLSTILFASVLKKQGGKLISFEHDADYAAHVSHMLAVRGLTEVVDLRIAPMSSAAYSSYEHPWYDVVAEDLPENVDLVLVDGPPMKFGLQVRLPGADLMAQRLVPGGCIMLDDAARPGEQAIKLALIAKYPLFVFNEPPSIPGCIVMTKPK